VALVPLHLRAASHVKRTIVVDIERFIYVQALAATGDALDGDSHQPWLRSQSTPAYVIESAEGVVTYSGFGKDADSRRARRWLLARLASYEAYPAPPDSSLDGD
jgi:hypothetical protein